jgi:hypothetical protein
VRGYAKYYQTDLLCAIVELRMLGVVVSAEYEEKIKLSARDRAMQKRNKKEAAENQDHLIDDKGEYFSFIVGYTSGGAAYGVPREDNRPFQPPML